MFEEKQTAINKRIDIKDKNIAYFNSVNAAINKQQGKDWDWVMWVEDRDRFFAEWEKWYEEATTFKSKPLTNEQSAKAIEDWQKHYNDISRADGIKADNLPIIHQ